MISKSFGILVCLSLVFCSGCAAKQEITEESILESDAENVAMIESNKEDTVVKVTKDVFAMDTYMTLTAYGIETKAEAAIDDAIHCIEILDAQLSTGLQDSEISQLNQNGTFTLSSDPSAIMKRALEISDLTDGAFRPTMYPLMEAWGFSTQKYRVPKETELQQLLALTNISDLKFDNATGKVSLLPDMKIDFGGIAKGYTSEKVMEVFRSHEIESGVISLGGNVQTLGCKTDGSLWRVAIQNPDPEADHLGVLEIGEKAVITSGGYERYFEQDGVSYHHIIDPATGKPADSGLLSVTIICEDGTLADGLSTALFIMGLERATAFWQEHSDMFDAVFLAEDNTLYVTENIQDQFSAISYQCNIIEKE